MGEEMDLYVYEDYLRVMECKEPDCNSKSDFQFLIYIRYPLNHPNSENQNRRKARCEK